MSTVGAFSGGRETDDLEARLVKALRRGLVMFDHDPMCLARVWKDWGCDCWHGAFEKVLDDYEAAKCSPAPGKMA